MNLRKKYVSDSVTLLKAVSHPVRFSIILCLHENYNLTVTQLTDKLSIEQPVVSLHLGVLRNCNIIGVEKAGKKSIYSIYNHSVRQIVYMIYNSQK